MSENSKNSEEILPTVKIQRYSVYKDAKTEISSKSSYLFSMFVYVCVCPHELQVCRNLDKLKEISRVESGHPNLALSTTGDLSVIPKDAGHLIRDHLRS